MLRLAEELQKFGMSQFHALCLPFVLKHCQKVSQYHTHQDLSVACASFITMLSAPCMSPVTTHNSIYTSDICGMIVFYLAKTLIQQISLPSDLKLPVLTLFHIVADMCVESACYREQPGRPCVLRYPRLACANNLWPVTSTSLYEVLPKSSGNLNSTREPVVVWPAAARWGEQYPL
jgi:hypothetical protein